MKLTRTITALLLAGILLPAIAACGGTTVTVGTTAGSETKTTQTTAVTTTAPPVTTPSVLDRQYPTVQPCNDINFANEGLKGKELIVNVAYVEKSGSSIGTVKRSTRRTSSERPSTGQRI